MPFLMRPEDFADKAFAAIEGVSATASFPWQMGVVAKVLRLLPNPLFDRLLAGRPRKHRQAEGAENAKSSQRSLSRMAQGAVQ